MGEFERGLLVVGFGRIVLDELLRKLFVHDGLLGRKDLVGVERRLVDDSVRGGFESESLRRSQRLLAWQ